MTNTSKTVLFFGSGPVAAASLAFLAKHFSIEAVVTKTVPPHHKQKAPVEELARALELPLLFANTKSELDTLFTQFAPLSQVGVIIDYGVIVSENVIGRFPLGIVNSHFSLLPQWRGADPITFSVLSGQDKTGVSLMVIEPTLDTGKLIVQRSLPIFDDTATPLLTEQLIELSNQLLLEYLPKYLDGQVTLRAQPHPDRATYSRKLTKQDGIIDWHKPAAEIEREIRAFADWPQSKARLGDVDVIITKAHVVPGEHAAPSSINLSPLHGLIIGTSDGGLAIDTLKPVGKKEMPVSAFLLGYRSRITTG